jgi:hypothetical protein
MFFVWRRGARGFVAQSSWSYNLLVQKIDFFIKFFICFFNYFNMLILIKIKNKNIILIYF